jgi:hypothetical protein
MTGMKLEELLSKLPHLGTKTQAASSTQSPEGSQSSQTSEAPANPKKEK